MTFSTTTLSISISRTFDASPETVFDQWLSSEAIADWFVPEGFSSIVAEADCQTGGRWHVAFSGPDGQTYRESGVFREIARPELLVLTLDHQSTHSFSTLVTVHFERTAEGTTLMRFHQDGYESKAQRDGVAEGWQTCFDKLARRLGEVQAERQIRALFEDWFAASSRKDLDASMAPIAESIVSYEHSTPLQVTSPAAMRAECKKGFDIAPDNFRWDIPDLKVIVRGDIAITWGLNRMAEIVDGEPQNAVWSRGTRVFRRTGSGWRMIHQHVSFPADPETGMARMDLVPDE